MKCPINPKHGKLSVVLISMIEILKPIVKHAKKKKVTKYKIC